MMTSSMNPFKVDTEEMIKIFGKNIKDYSTNTSAQSNPTFGPVSYGSEFSTYQGQFKNGQRCGYGRSVYIDGSIYEGMWKDGQRDGRGIFMFADGEFYLGSFIKDKANGRGKHLNGNILTGR